MMASSQITASELTPGGMYAEAMTAEELLSVLEGDYIELDDFEQ